LLTLISILNENPLYGAKYLDIIDFGKAVIYLNKQHLTPEGIAQIRELASSMKSSRIF
jgi:hypothetical protein